MADTSKTRQLTLKKEERYIFLILGWTVPLTSKNDVDVDVSVQCSPLVSIDHRCLYFHCIADKLREYQDNALLQQETDEQEKRAALHTDLTRYWAAHQRVEDSRDADLKCGLKGACSITIPECKLGPASMTVFEVSRCLVCMKHHWSKIQRMVK